MFAFLLHNTLGCTAALDNSTAKWPEGLISAGEGNDQNMGRDWLLMGTEKNRGLVATKLTRLTPLV